MTPLAVELLRILTDAGPRSPMTPDSLARVLYCLGWSPMPSTTEIAATLDGLLAGGWIEAVNSARLGRRFRILQNGPGRDLSQPDTARPA
jgi:hypothetical protein